MELLGQLNTINLRHRDKDNNMSNFKRYLREALREAMEGGGLMGGGGASEIDGRTPTLMYNPHPDWEDGYIEDGVFTPPPGAKWCKGSPPFHNCWGRDRHGRIWGCDENNTHCGWVDWYDCPQGMVYIPWTSCPTCDPPVVGAQDMNDPCSGA